MRLTKKLLFSSVLFLSVLSGCVAPGPDDDVAEASQEVQAAARGEELVRSYYAAARAEDPAAALRPIFADDVVISAPSIRILKGVSELRGKEPCVKAVAGGAFLIGRSPIREIVSKGNLVIARIDMPLPNGDVLTQVEYFVIRGDKIARMDSYYDAMRFAAALPAVAFDRLRNALRF